MDITKIRSQFPALNQLYKGITPIFFDGPGGAQVPQSVLDSIVDYLGSSNANLGGAYFTSHKTEQLMKEARKAAADLYNAGSVDEIVFGANATTITFQMSRAIANTWEAGDEIIVTALDHYSNVSPWQLAAQEKGVIVRQVPVIEENCSVDYRVLEKLINEKTKLVAVTYASNTTGSIVDIEQVVQRVKGNSKALVYVDAVHFAPHRKIDVQAINCDFLVSSAYKYFGPHLGVLYARAEHLSALTPYRVEPAKDINPNRWETGTQNYEALAGFVQTINYIASLSQLDSESLNIATRRQEHLRDAFNHIRAWELELSNYFLKEIKAFESVQLFGMPNSQARTPTFAIRIKDIAPRVVSEFFAQHAVCIWDGNFYAKGLYDQLDLTDKGGMIRIGCMHYNTKEELERFFTLLEECIDLHS